MSVDLPTIVPGTAVPEPITISTDYSRADRLYRRGVWAVSMGVLVLLFLIGLFLLMSGFPAFRVAGWRFFTTSGFQTLGKHPVFGVLASLVGTLEVAAGGHVGGHAGRHRHRALPQRVRAALGRAGR